MAARQIPLGQQLLVGLDDDVPCHGELLGEDTGGRQGFPVCELALEDPLAEPQGKLLGQGGPRGPVQTQSEHEHPRDWFPANRLELDLAKTN